MDTGPPPLAALPPAIPSEASVDSGAAQPARPWGFWLTLVFGFVIAMAEVIAQTAVVLAAAITQGKLGDPHAIEALAYNGLVLSIATLLGLPVTVGLVVVFAFIRPGIRVADYLGLRPARWKPTALGLLAVFVAGIAFDLLSRWAGRPDVPEFMVRVYQSAGFPPLLWIAVVIGAPIGEEVFFRGFLFSGLAKSRLGGWGAVVVTSLAWASVHVQYDLCDIGYIFCLGLIIGAFRLKTGSLWPPLLMHALVNLVATIQVALLLG